MSLPPFPQLAESSIRKPFPWMWLAVLLALGGAHMLNFPLAWDDAFISFRVAEHWAQSGTLAYNLGESQPVATSFFWVILLGAAHKVSGLDTVLLSQILGGLAGLGILTGLLVGARRWAGMKTALPAAILCLSAAAWAAWPLSGLETAWFTALLTLGVVLLLPPAASVSPRGVMLAAACFGLATLTRPDGLLFFIISLIYVVIQTPRAVARWGLLLISFAAVAVPGLSGQAAAYHTLIPNAALAKWNGAPQWHAGWAYLLDLVRSYRLEYLLPFVVLALAERERRMESWYLVSLIAGWSIYVACLGGDFMPYHRLLSPAWPLLCLLAGRGLAALAEALTRLGVKSAVWMAVLLASLTGFYSVLALLPSYRGPHFERWKQWSAEETDRAAVGHWLRANYPPTDRLALKPAGIIPYYSDLPAKDFYCLVDRGLARTGPWMRENWIGHQRVNVPGVLAWRPRLVILDEHLYPLERLPAPDGGTGVVEAAWRAAPERNAYALKRAEIQPGRWLQFYELARR